MLLVLLTFQFLIGFSACQTKFCKRSCPVNEVFLSNVSKCQNTCFNRNFNQTSKCSTGPGCVCSQGRTRHQETYKCIPLKYCDSKKNAKTCPSSEVWSDCGARCQRTCKNNNQLIKCSCVSGCVCRAGFIRSDVNFQCIPEKLCQNCPVGYSFSNTSKTCGLNCKACRQNESYNFCGSPCETTCSNPTNAGILCIQVCQEGCFCNKGYVRDLKGLCVKLLNCPKPCPKNESYSCGNPLCETNCQTLNKPCTIFQIRCEDKCYCNDGYVRALEKGQCVSKDHCPIINRSPT